MAALRGALGTWLAEEKKQTAASTEIAAVPPEMLEKLGALGYVGAGTGSPTAATGADPKDKLEDYKVVNRLMREGLVALREGHPKDSIARFRELLGRGIESFEVHYYLARALSDTSSYREAAKHFERSLARLPGYGAAYVGLANARVAMGDAQGALAALQRGAKAAPRDSQIPLAEARVCRRLERPADAIRAYERAAFLAPRNALVRVQLGEMYRDRNEPDKAIASIRQAVALEPGQASYWNSLGMVLGGKGELADAEKAFREAVGRDSKNPSTTTTLASRCCVNPADEAVPYLRETLALQPGFTAARDRLREIER